MREIKFRAWDYDRKEMIYFDNLRVEDTGGFWGGTREVWKMSANYGRGTCEGLGYFHDDFSQKSNVELMQFTGLHDNNGKEIYEGDKVRIRGGRKPKGQERPYYETEVIYKANGFYLKENYSVFVDQSAVSHCEVIGNIHEQ